MHYFLSDDLGAGSEVGLLSFLPVSLSLSTRDLRTGRYLDTRKFLRWACVTHTALFQPVGSNSRPNQGVVFNARRSSRRSIASSINRVISALGDNPEASHIFGYIDTAVNPGMVFTSLT